MNIVVGKLRELPERFGREVVLPQIHSILRAPVGDKINFIVCPHGEFVAGIVGF